MEYPRYRSVVFDAPSVLLRPMPEAGYFGWLKMMADVLGVERAAFARLWDVDTSLPRYTGELSSIADNVVAICGRLGASPSAEQVRQAADLRWQMLREATRPRDGADRCLTRLRAHNLLVAALGDCSVEVPHLWSRHPLRPRVDAALFSCSLGWMKPDPRVYRAICDETRVPPGLCLYVGAATHDGPAGALDAGMDAMLFRPGAAAPGWPGPVARTFDDVVRYAFRTRPEPAAAA